jgi:hypothetical protein
MVDWGASSFHSRRFGAQLGLVQGGLVVSSSDFQSWLVVIEVSAALDHHQLMVETENGNADNVHL